MTHIRRTVTALVFDPASTPGPFAPSAAHPVKLGLSFDDSRPFEVRLRLTDEDGVTSPPWRFERSLLKAACMVMSLDGCEPPEFGRGDVRISASGNGSLAFRLSIRGIGEVFVGCAAALPCAFICDVDRLVPPDAAAYDVDAWIAGLLGEQPC